MDFSQRIRTHFRYLLIVFLCSFPFTLCAAIDHLLPIVINKLKHDRQAFTQGLSIENDQLYESTGLYGRSSLRHLDILTGTVLQKHSLSPHIFAEGLAVFPHQLIQITWKEQKAFIYEVPSLKLLQTLFYRGEGWGLCREENWVWMSNGTSVLTQRDPKTFAALKTLQVYLDGHPLAHLNDLEWDGNHLYANVWQEDWIVRIDKISGEVTGIVDASHLLSRQEKTTLGAGDVLNGIAYRPKTNTFFITGKGWPWIFEVRLVSNNQFKGRLHEEKKPPDLI
jgi:glutaminyl-peptide cyclotransferase